MELEGWKSDVVFCRLGSSAMMHRQEDVETVRYVPLQNYNFAGIGAGLDGFSMYLTISYSLCWNLSEDQHILTLRVGLVKAVKLTRTSRRTLVEKTSARSSD